MNEIIDVREALIKNKIYEISVVRQSKALIRIYKKT